MVEKYAVDFNVTMACAYRRIGRLQKRAWLVYTINAKTNEYKIAEGGEADDTGETAKTKIENEITQTYNGLCKSTYNGSYPRAAVKSASVFCSRGYGHIAAYTPEKTE
jgi:hypothetical protein